MVMRSPAPSRGGAPKSTHDKSLYVHLMGTLKKKSLLPVVVFTFSKKRCEENAGTLMNLDLSTSTEKSQVHTTIEDALKRLKGVCTLSNVPFCMIWGVNEIDWTTVCRPTLPFMSSVGAVLY
jgi:superfamily II RNA helicase